MKILIKKIAFPFFKRVKIPFSYNFSAKKNKKVVLQKTPEKPAEEATSEQKIVFYKFMKERKEFTWEDYYGIYYVN